MAPWDESYESRDRELGAVLRGRVQAHAGSVDIRLRGPLESAGMDPTWILTIATAALDAEVHVFYGPQVEVAAFRLEALYSYGARQLTDSGLIGMVDDLVAAGRGGALPGWLRPAE